ncbi:MAG TPA: hypothetical protein VE954_14155 [Oligoflexus sp.]|uniref:hypothetical protein n=1 Tax=Oligoflexus sp. TaxID=1971216 RepID=UPI002D6155AC|nr:hypothetical protein [Oligoflexus sp.]HYX34242.1 hypothetical protein [Oligoflexus sp.]
MNTESIIKNCYIVRKKPEKTSLNGCNRRSLILGAAVSPLFLRSIQAQAERLTLTQDDVRDYAQESVANITASNVGPIPEYDVDEVYGNISDVFNDNTTYDSRSDQTIGNDLISHYIQQGRQNYTPYEQQFAQSWTGPLNLDYYRRKFAQRANHLSECFMCGGLIRSQCEGANIRLIIFDPGYAIYEGDRLPVEEGFIVIGGAREPLRYNTDRYYWYFGNNQRLFF